MRVDLTLSTNAPQVLDKVAKKFENVGGKADKLANKFRTVGSGLDSALKFESLNVLNNTISSIFDNVKKLSLGIATSFITVNSNLEQMRIMMSTATGSIEGGKQAVADLLEFSDRAPFSISALADSFVKLKTSGIDPLDGTLQTLVDSVAAFGGTSEQLKLVTIAIQQMVGKGVISMEELRRQFGEQVPTAIKAMAHGLGYADDEIGDMYDRIKKGALEAGTGIKAMLQELAKQHGGAALARMESFEGTIIRFKNEWTRLMKDVGEGNGAFSSISKAIDSAREALNTFRTSAEGAAIVEKISGSIKKVFDDLAQNPDKFVGFFEAIGNAIGFVMEQAQKLTKILGAVIVTVDTYSNKVNGNDLLNAGIDPSQIPLDKYLQVRDILIQLSEAQEKLQENTIKGAFQSGSMVDSAQYLANKVKEAFNIQPEFDDTKAKAEIEELRKKLIDELTGTKPKIDVDTSKANSSADKFKFKIEDIASSLGESLENSTKEFEDIMSGFEQKRFDISIEFGTDEQKNAKILEYVDKLKEKAAAAWDGSAEGYENQVAYLEKAKKLLEDMRYEGKEVSAQELESARQAYEYQLRITRGGKNAYGDAAAPFEKARDEYLKLLDAFQKGEKVKDDEAIASRQQQLEEINDLLLQGMDKVEETVAAQDEVVKSLQEKDKTEAELHKNFVERKAEEVKEIDNSAKAWDIFSDVVGQIQQNIRDGIQETIEKLKEQNSLLNSVSASSSSVSGRATGGPVIAGVPIEVGELGREVFVPNSNGYIIPNNQLDTKGSNVINLNVAFGKEVAQLQGTPTNVKLFIKKMAEIERYKS